MTDKSFRPLLALDLSKIKGELQFPLLASPKLDGVRCLVIGGVPTSRSLKPLPNRHLATWADWARLEGLDGELIIGEPTAPDAYNRTTSAVMSHDAPLDDLRFYVFDHFGAPAAGYAERRSAAGFLLDIADTRGVAGLLPQYEVADAQEMSRIEAEVVAQGYEGLMLRDPSAAYKFGRTAAGGRELLKMKRFEDSEAEILGAHPLMRNGNAAETNELGLTKRSTQKANMVADELLGALDVRDIKTGVEFSIGSGFDLETRRRLWQARGALPGQLVKYKAQPAGAKDAPRFPVYLGLRDRIDMEVAAHCSDPTNGSCCGPSIRLHSDHGS